MLFILRKSEGHHGKNVNKIKVIKSLIFNGVAKKVILVLWFDEIPSFWVQICAYNVGTM